MLARCGASGSVTRLQRPCYVCFHVGAAVSAEAAVAASCGGSVAQGDRPGTLHRAVDVVMGLLDKPGVRAADVAVIAPTYDAVVALERMLDTRLAPGTLDLGLTTVQNLAAGLLADVGGGPNPVATPSDVLVGGGGGGGSVGGDSGGPTGAAVALQRDDALAWTLFRASILELPLRKFRPPNAPHRFSASMFAHFKRLAAAGVSPSQYASFAGGERGAGGGTAGGGGGGPHPELAAAYAAWTDMKLRHGVLQADDPVRFAVELMQDHPWLRDRVQTAHPHVVVVDVQAMTRGELMLLERLLVDHPDVSLVGSPWKTSSRNTCDTDAGATYLRQALPTAQFEWPVRLGSTPAISRHVSALMDGGGGGGGAAADAAVAAVASTPAISPTATEFAVVSGAHCAQSTPDGVCTYLGFLSPEAEMHGVVRLALAVLDDPESGIASATLFARSTEAALAMQAIAASTTSSVRVTCTERPALRSHREIRWLIAVLSVLADVHVDQHLYFLGCSDLYGVPPSTMASATAARVSSTVASPRDASVDQLMAHIQQLQTMVGSAPPSAILGRFLRLSGLAAELARPDTPQKEAASNAIAAFLRVCRRRERSATVALVPFLLDQILADASRPSDDAASHHDPVSDPSNAPHLVVSSLRQADSAAATDAVFVLGCVDTHLPGAFRAPPLPVPLDLVCVPGTGSGSSPGMGGVDGVVGAPSVTRDQHETAKRRLLATAVASAHKAVVLSSKDTASVPVSPPVPRRTKRSRFLDTLFLGGPPVVAVSVEDSSCAAPTTSSGAASGGSTTSGSSPTTEPLALSFSSMFDYRWCPKRYHLRKVLGVPTVGNAAMLYGLALHAAVEVCGGALRFSSPLDTFDMDALTADMRDAFTAKWQGGMQALGQPMPAPQRALLETAGMSAIQSFAARAVAEVATGDVTPLHVEYPFELAVPEAHVTLRGFIDRIDRCGDDGGIVLKEFKSGSLWRHEVGPVGDPLQLKVYSYAILRDFGQLPARADLEAIESGDVKRFQPSDRTVDQVLTAVTATATAIRAGRFDPKPSPVSCELCPVKHACTASRGV